MWMGARRGSRQQTTKAAAPGWLRLAGVPGGAFIHAADPVQHWVARGVRWLDWVGRDRQQPGLPAAPSAAVARATPGRRQPHQQRALPHLPQFVSGSAAQRTACLCGRRCLRCFCQVSSTAHLALIPPAPRQAAAAAVAAIPASTVIAAAAAGGATDAVANIAITSAAASASSAAICQQRAAAAPDPAPQQHAVAVLQRLVPRSRLRRLLLPGTSGSCRRAASQVYKGVSEPHQVQAGRRQRHRRLLHLAPPQQQLIL